MTRLTANCQIAAFGINMRERGVYQKILSEFLKVIDEENMSALQLTPEGWPVKCKITVTEEKIKEEIVSQGLTLFNKHVDFEDDNDLLIKIIVKDGHPEWEDDFFKKNLQEYATVVLVEKEWLHLNGRRTKISTGTRYVYVTEVNKHIPQRLQFTVNDRSFNVTAWCPSGANKPVTSQEPVRVGNTCVHCGAEHTTESCPHKKRVCFICQESDHSQRECPKNKGVKYDEDTLIFFNSKSPLSNWNTEYPFKVDCLEYICVEQFLTVEKAYYFGNPSIAQQAMFCTDPKKLLELGKNIPNFNAREWNSVYDNVMKKALFHKFSDPAARGAREHLMSSEDRIIGEASRHNYWGTGLVASDPASLDTDAWTGNNMLGQYLMAIREKIKEETKQAESAQKALVNTQSATGNSAPPPDLNQSNSSIEIQEDQVQTPNTYAIIFGDGNVPKDIVNESKLPMKIVDCSRGEMKFGDVKEAISKCMIPKDKVDFIVYHLGSCHWHENETITEAESVHNELLNAITDACDAFPKAEFIVSGVPLRDPSLARENPEKLEEINIEIKKFNNLLAAFARSERTVTFCDNQNILVTEDSRAADQMIFYENSNQLNENGRSMLQANLEIGIAEAIKLNLLAGGEWKRPRKVWKESEASNNK